MCNFHYWSILSPVANFHHQSLHNYVIDRQIEKERLSATSIYRSMGA